MTRVKNLIAPTYLSLCSICCEDDVYLATSYFGGNSRFRTASPILLMASIIFSTIYRLICFTICRLLL